MREPSTLESIRFPQKSYPNAPLADRLGRRITYLRLSITDRCNLRCRYCRPEKGVDFIPHDEILRYEELERLVSIFTSLGVTKVRVTGGEPFSRLGCMDFLARLRQMPGVQSLHITTNGVETGKYLDDLADIAIDAINLSLDTLDPRRFWSITRRNYFDAVLKTFRGAIDRNIPLKVNSVVLSDTSDEEIRSLASLAKEHPVTLRFIEKMPFSGSAPNAGTIDTNLLPRLQRIFPGLTSDEANGPTSARTFSLPGYPGKIGIIAGFSRLFCATCNKVRITPVGMLKTCLYDNGALDLKELLRGNTSDDEILEAVACCVHNRFVNGHEAEKNSYRLREPSMAMIGG